MKCLQEYLSATFLNILLLLSHRSIIIMMGDLIRAVDATSVLLQETYELIMLVTTTTADNSSDCVHHESGPK